MQSIDRTEPVENYNGQKEKEKESMNHEKCGKETELNEVCKRLNEEKYEVDALLERLEDSEIESKKTLSKLEKEECARKKLEFENFNLELHIQKLEDYERARIREYLESEHLREELDKVSRLLVKEKMKSKHLLESNIRQEYTIYFLTEQLIRRQTMAVRYQHKESAASMELYHVKKRLDEVKDQVDDLLEELDEEKIELKTTLYKLKVEECARKGLQLKNSNLNSKLINLREEFTGFQCDFLKVVKEKSELEERLAEVSQSLVEEGEVKASVGQLIRTKNQVIKEIESKEDVTETTLHDAQEDHIDGLRPYSNNKETHMMELLSKLEEGRSSIRGQQISQQVSKLTNLKGKHPKTLKSIWGSFFMKNI